MISVLPKLKADHSLVMSGVVISGSNLRNGMSLLIQFSVPLLKTDTIWTTASTKWLMFDWVLSCFMSDESFAKPRVPGACTAYHVLPVTREHAACHVATQQQVWIPYLICELQASVTILMLRCLHAMCRRARVYVWTHFSPFMNECTIVKAKTELPTYFTSYHDDWK